MNGDGLEERGDSVSEADPSTSAAAADSGNEASSSGGESEFEDAVESQEQLRPDGSAGSPTVGDFDHGDDAFGELDAGAEKEAEETVPLLVRSHATVPESYRVLEKDLHAAAAAKEAGNEAYGAGRLEEAVDLYGKAIALCPDEEEHHYSRSVFHGNRAAVLLKQGELNGVVEDCSLALELQPKYVKALMRRSQAYERQDKLEEALADVNAVLEVDGTIVLARRKAQELERRVKEKQEKMKEEMMGKLKDLGNTLLGKFGMSLDNFEMKQDPNSGSYSINFKQGGAGQAAAAAPAPAPAPQDTPPN